MQISYRDIKKNILKLNIFSPPKSQIFINQKVILYLTKAVMQLNYLCNNIIKEEKFQRAIIIFTNRNEDFETIKRIIDWHVENEKKQYNEHLKRKRKYEQNRSNKIKSLQKTRVA